MINFIKTALMLVLCLGLVNCKEKSKSIETDTIEVSEDTDVTYVSFGKDIMANDAIEANSMAAHYEAMNPGDSINAKLKANVQEVCQAKGCWMKLDLNNGEEVMVKFKDYGFFVPKDIAGKSVIINGKAFVEEVSVDDQIHYAKDEGLSEEEIAKITEPKKTYSFLADGVLVEKEGE